MATTTTAFKATDYDYVDEINQNLLCPICYCPFITPVSSPCGHTFCQDCITFALASTPTPSCPIDRTPLSLTQVTPAAKLISSLLDELHVFCPNRKDGCTWIGQRQSLNSHLSVHCLYAQEDVRRGELESHMRECSYRAEACTRCNRTIRKMDFAVHVSECSAGTASCMHCKRDIRRSDLAGHISDCPEAIVSCTHVYHGCAWEGQRKVLNEQHLVTCPFEAIKGFFRIHDQRQQAMEEENRELRRQLADLRQQVEALRERPLMISPPEAAMVPPIVGETADRIGQLLAETDQLRSDLVNLSAGFSAMEMRQDMALLCETSRLREEMHSVRALCQAVQSQLINFALDRRKEASASSSTSKSVLSSAISALAGGSSEGASASRGSHRDDADRSRTMISQFRQDGSTKL
ncbi:hypothetical protein SpCBS45565_g03073 [Spizellomyces sp. 'palustris']|nr:hypothetical protein SpCBS45565_g03073 [Spizellomyces sp. 'palustris']